MHRGYQEDGRWIRPLRRQAVYRLRHSVPVPQRVGRIPWVSSTGRAAGSRGAARIWDVEIGDELQLIRAHAGRKVEWVGFRDADLVTAGRDGTVRVWPVKIHPHGPLDPLLGELTSDAAAR